MNVVVKFGVRDAIPVRAIPWLTDWKTMTPDSVALALSGDESFFEFAAMRAYRVADPEPIRARWWHTHVLRPLMALSKTISMGRAPREVGTQEWQKESLKRLPRGVFVWRDEFTQAHQRHYRNATLPLGSDGKDAPLTDGEVADLTAQHEQRIALDFSPFVDEELYALIMDGFRLNAEPSQKLPAHVAETAVPVASVSDQHAARILDGSMDVAKRVPPTEQLLASSPAPSLTTSEIAQCFDGVMFGVDRWRRNLSSAEWAGTARIARGVQGGASALWNPMTLAQLIHGRQRSEKDKENILKAMNGRFNRLPTLAPWRSDFREYFATYFETA